MLTLTRDPQAPAVARRWLADELRSLPDLDEACLDQLAVMTSEVVTNVLVHTDSAPRVDLVVAPGQVRVEVHDDDPHTPEVRQPDPSRVGGNGMLIVAAFSADWGVEQIEGDGKVVWFTVPA